MGSQLTAEPRETGRFDVTSDAVGRTPRVGQVRLRGLAAPVISGARGPEASARREAVFRFALAVADTAALMITLVVVAMLSGGRLDLLWGSVGAIPILWLAAKLLGL
jgi:hypothetical protein